MNQKMPSNIQSLYLNFLRYKLKLNECKIEDEWFVYWFKLEVIEIPVILERL